MRRSRGSGRSRAPATPRGRSPHTGRLPPDPPELPTGEIRQRPPIYSAVKIGGERAYRRARRGERFEMPERIVTVYRFEQLWRERGRVAGRAPRAGYEIECGSGTYVRSLIADLQRRLLPGAPAHGDRSVRRARRGRAAGARPGASRRRGADPPLIPLQRALAALSK